MKKMSKKKMMTGGMSNPNAAAQKQTTPGSNGVKVKMNGNVAVSPSKMYGGKMKMGGATKTKMGYGGMKKKAC